MWWMIGALAVSAIGTALQAEGQKKASDAQIKAAKAQAQIALLNAKIGERRFRRKTDELISNQITGYAKSGVLFEGSPVAVMEQTAAQAEMEALIIKHGGQIEANALLEGAGNIQSAQQVNTAATILGGVGQMAQTGMGYNANTY